jgi:hypothetical protein
MNFTAALLAALIACGQAEDHPGRIDGIVVDGSAEQKPLAGIEVVLCVRTGGQTVPVESTTSDAYGRFRFSDLPCDEEFSYLPGANRQEIHYPGPRIRLTDIQPHAEVQLVAYDTVSSESPLVVRRHEVNIRTEGTLVYVSEVMTVENPSTRTYVGESFNDMPPVTFRLSIPTDFEKVTFERESVARQFMVLDDRVLTSMPWMPGERTLRFSYGLPIEERHRVLRRKLDLPTTELVVTVDENTTCQACNLAATANASDQRLAFASPPGKPLPAGHVLELELGELPVPLMAYAKWGALLLLGVLVSSSLWKLNRISQSALVRVPQQASSR